ncbi:Hypothetical protein Cul210931_1867 [Corynebacterium ulcerans]|nr:Hypothetical protein Cul210931_1867 [Corynebacterium ulcerans]
MESRTRQHLPRLQTPTTPSNRPHRRAHHPRRRYTRRKQCTERPMPVMQQPPRSGNVKQIPKPDIKPHFTPEKLYAPTTQGGRPTPKTARTAREVKKGV